MRDSFLQKKEKINELNGNKKCQNCGCYFETYNEYKVCKKCGFNFVMSVNERIKLICDVDSFKELKINIDYGYNDFPGYKEQIIKYQNKTNLDEAIKIGTAKINGIDIAIGIMDANFMCGTVGVVVGEKIVSLIEYATEQSLPLVFFSASGGIRVQEGVKALVQMSKISAAIEQFSRKGLLFISYLTNPTMGGLNASLSMLGDIIIAEDNCTIGFTGARVIKQILREELPKDFQNTDYNFKNGFIDIITNRQSSKKLIYEILKKCKNKSIPLKKIEYSKTTQENKIAIKDIYYNIRSNKHIKAKELINNIFKNKLDLNGDRISGNDEAIKCYLGDFNNIDVMIISTNKGTNLEENIKSNFGMISPEGYRKIMKNIKLAEKFSLPVIFFVDTPGANPNVSSESNGQSFVIANLIKTLSTLRVPILSFITGEANSGGALGLLVGDYVAMLENSVLSVISPEAFSSIVFKEEKRLEDITNLMEVSPKQNLDNKIIDEVIYDSNIENISSEIKIIINNVLCDLLKKSEEELIINRQKRIRNWGNI